MCKILQASWKPGTEKQYQSAWKQFFSWCSQRSCDPFCCSLNIISDYLVDLLYKGLEYKTINSLRSAISMTHLPVDGICVGSHPFISRLMKGIQIHSFCHIIIPLQCFTNADWLKKSQHTQCWTLFCCS